FAPARRSQMPEWQRSFRKPPADGTNRSFENPSSSRDAEVTGHPASWQPAALHPPADLKPSAEPIVRLRRSKSLNMANQALAHLAPPALKSSSTRSWQQLHVFGLRRCQRRNALLRQILAIVPCSGIIEAARLSQLCLKSHSLSVLELRHSLAPA